MPRSDRFYFFAIIGFCFAVFLFSVLATGRAVSGSRTQDPEYRNSPPPVSYDVPDASIIDNTYISDNPLTDRDFSIIHRNSRELVPLLLTADEKYIERVKKLAASPRTIENLRPRLTEARSYIQNLQPERNQPVRTVEVGDMQSSPRAALDGSDQPEEVDRVDVRSSLRYAPKENDGTQGITSISFTFYWQRINDGDWKIVSIAVIPLLPGAADPTGATSQQQFDADTGEEITDLEDEAPLEDPAITPPDSEPAPDEPTGSSSETVDPLDLDEPATPTGEPADADGDGVPDDDQAPIAP